MDGQQVRVADLLELLDAQRAAAEREGVDGRLLEPVVPELDTIELLHRASEGRVAGCILTLMTRTVLTGVRCPHDATSVVLTAQRFPRRCDRQRSSPVVRRAYRLTKASQSRQSAILTSAPRGRRAPRSDQTVVAEHQDDREAARTRESIVRDRRAGGLQQHVVLHAA